MKEFSIGGHQFSFNSHPAIMGVINLSPDSWYRESVRLTTDAAVRRGNVLRAQGAAIVDLGAESTLAHASRADDALQNAKFLPVMRCAQTRRHQRWWVYQHAPEVAWKTLDSRAFWPVMRGGRMFCRRTQLLLLLSLVAACGCVSDSARRGRPAIAEANAVQFLKREVPAWSRKNGCFSCHNNGDGARALYAAMRKGYRIPGRILADTTGWVAQPHRWEHNKGDPGFSDLRLANVQFAASLLAALEAGLATDRQPLQEAARKVCADQGADGAWHIEPRNVVGSPATYGTTLATYMALRTLKQANAGGTSDAIRKAEDWLRQARPNNILSAATLLLASAGDSEKSADSKREECLTVIRSGQARDGGWGPYADSPPEPFDTAVVLLSLAEIRFVPGVAERIRRGRRFLADRQNPDGSWPATTRPPGGNSYAQRVSTTAWATLALLATRESP